MASPSPTKSPGSNNAASPSNFIMSDADLPFSDRLKLRENILSWISRDVGLTDFFFPPTHAAAAAMTTDQKNAYVLSVVRNYLGCVSTELSVPPASSAGENMTSAQSRCLMRENAAHMRRAVLAMRRGRVTHHDVARFSLLLEALWDEINVTLSDASWAMCSLKFDTSQVSLRLVYVWLYMAQEFPPSGDYPLPARRAAYAALVDAFFKDKAPLDAKEYDKHSTNFKCLLLAWYSDLTKGTADLDRKLRGIQHSNSLSRTADFVDAFLRHVLPDEWMLHALALTDAWQNNKLSKRTGPKRTKRSKAVPADDDITFATQEQMEHYFANDGVTDDDEDEDEDEDEDGDHKRNNAAANGTTTKRVHKRSSQQNTRAKLGSRTTRNGQTLTPVSSERKRKRKVIDEDYSPSESPPSADDDGYDDYDDTDDVAERERQRQRQRLRRGGNNQSRSRSHSRARKPVASKASPSKRGRQRSKMR